MTGKDLMSRLRANRGSEPTLLVVGIVGYLALVLKSNGDLLEGNSIKGILIYLTVPILIGLAQLVVLAVGQMNLSVGALGGFLSVWIAALIVDSGLPPLLAAGIGIAGGALVGVVNGVLVVVTRINGFIVTLATMTILIGLQYRVAGTRTITLSDGWFTDFGSADVLNIPLIFIAALVVAAVLAFFLRRAVPGRRLLASGGNPLAARLSGISNDRSLILAHGLSGLIIGVAAVLTVMSAPGVNKSIGGDWLLPSFAAPIIGGAALAGGAVSVLGTILAAFIVRLVDVARAQYSLDPSLVNFTIGAVVLGTVVLGTIRENRAARAPKDPPKDTAKEAAPLAGSPS